MNPALDRYLDRGPGKCAGGGPFGGTGRAFERTWPATESWRSPSRVHLRIKRVLSTYIVECRVSKSTITVWVSIPHTGTSDPWGYARSYCFRSTDSLCYEIPSHQLGSKPIEKFRLHLKIKVGACLAGFSSSGW